MVKEYGQSGTTQSIAATWDGNVRAGMRPNNQNARTAHVLKHGDSQV